MSGGKQPKKLIVIDDSKTKSANLADEFISLKPEDAVSFVRGLRQTLVKEDSSSELLKQMAIAKYGSVFLGKPPGTDAEFDVATDQWFQLVRDLNDHTRFVMSSLSEGRNRNSANNVLTSLCGFPDSVRFTSEGPMYNGLEYSTANVLARKECDFLLACDTGNSEPFESLLNSETVEWLKSIPVAVLSDFPANRHETADVHVAVGTPGWSASGDFVRTDDIPIPMDALSGVENHSTIQLFNELLAD